MARLTLKKAPMPDPDAMYEPVQSFSNALGTFAAGVRLSGGHQAVRAHFGSFMLASLPDDQKSRIRTAAMFGAQPTSAHDQHAEPPVAEPPAGRFRALVSRRLPADLASRGRISPGDIVDADDPVFKRFPHYFVAHLEDR